MEKLCSVCYCDLSSYSRPITNFENKMFCNSCLSRTRKYRHQQNAVNASLNDIINDMDENKRLNNIFSETLFIRHNILFDDNHKLFKVNVNSDLNYKICSIFKYSEIVDVQIFMDDEDIKKSGAGRAVGGALLFGPAGAIVGGLSSRGKHKKKVTRKMYLSLTIDNGDIYKIYFINSKVKTDSYLYRKAEGELSNTIRKLQNIIEENNKLNNTHDRSNNIKQELFDLKELLDAGIITQDEFDKRKNKILDS